MSDLLKTCPACNGFPLNPDSVLGGEGQDPQVQTCAVCNGDYTIPSGQVEDQDITDKLNDILDKCNDIFEKLNE